MRSDTDGRGACCSAKYNSPDHWPLKQFVYDVICGDVKQAVRRGGKRCPTNLKSVWQEKYPGLWTLACLGQTPKGAGGKGADGKTAPWPFDPDTGELMAAQTGSGAEEAEDGQGGGDDCSEPVKVKKADPTAFLKNLVFMQGMVSLRMPARTKTTLAPAHTLEHTLLTHTDNVRCRCHLCRSMPAQRIRRRTCGAA